MKDDSREDVIFCPNCGKAIPANLRLCPKCGHKIASNKAATNHFHRSVISTKTKEVSNKNPSNKARTWKDCFPYLKARPLQKPIIEKITEAYEKKSNVIIEAANGVGKTIAVLSALLPNTLNDNRTIIYCCRTHQQVSRVIDELKMIRQLTHVSGVALKARKELCLHPILTKYAVDSQNAAEICRFLKKSGKCKYFTRLSKTEILEEIKEYALDQALDSTELKEIGEHYEICPFELTKILLPDVNVIAANYQHVFNPHIRNVIFGSIEKDISDIVLVIDEAHNLPNVAVDISSKTMSNFSLENALTELLKVREGTYYDWIEAFLAVLVEETRKLSNGSEKRIDPAIFIEKTNKRASYNLTEGVVEALEIIGEKIKEIKITENKAPMSYVSSVASFLRQLLETKGHSEYAHFVAKSETRTGAPIQTFTNLCLDPRQITEEIFVKVYSSISISGTLEPVEAYKALTGIEKTNNLTLVLPSPYQKNNILTLVIDQITSKLADRTPETFKRIIEVIEAVTESTPKNVGVFCASYAILDNLIQNGLQMGITKPLFIAYQGMESNENDKLIEQFKNESQRQGGVLLSVLGGRSSEGSDYPAEQMHSVIVVGIPYAKPTPSVQATIEYLDSQFPGKGREYGYHIPAISRASQAAGRPIRSLNDYAVVVLADSRYAKYYYRKFLPNWLTQNMRIVPPNKSHIKNLVQKFFQEHTR